MKTLCLFLVLSILCIVPRADAAVDTVMAAKATFAGFTTATDGGGNALLIKTMVKNKELINLAMGRPIGDPNLPNESLGLAANDASFRTFSTSGTPDIELVIYDNTTLPTDPPVILKTIGKLTGTVQIGENHISNAFKRVLIGVGTFDPNGSITGGTLQSATTLTRKPTDAGPVPKITTSVTGFVSLTGPKTIFIVKGKISVSGAVRGR